MRTPGSGADVPVDPTYIVTELVLPDLFEFHAHALEGGVILTGKQLIDDPGGRDLDSPDSA
jgi:hypothetical protein